MTEYAVYLTNWSSVMSRFLKGEFSFFVIRLQEVMDLMQIRDFLYYSQFLNYIGPIK